MLAAYGSPLPETQPHMDASQLELQGGGLRTLPRSRCLEGGPSLGPEAHHSQGVGTHRHMLPGKTHSQASTEQMLQNLIGCESPFSSWGTQARPDCGARGTRRDGQE